MASAARDIGGLLFSSKHTVIAFQIRVRLSALNTKSAPPRRSPLRLVALTMTSFALVLTPGLGHGQIVSPSPVEGDLSPEETAPKRPATEPQPPDRPSPPPLVRPQPQPAKPKPAEPAQPPLSEPTKPAQAATTTPAPAPPATTTRPAPDEPFVLSEKTRPIEPVKTSPQEILRLWNARKRALREQDPATARKSREAISAAMRELGIENLTTYATAEVLESSKSLAARVSADAIEHASFAVDLAPDLPETHAALARARWASEPGRPMAVFSELWAGARAVVHEPHASRAVIADLCAAALAALLAAGAASILVLFAKKLRLFVHDFHHLPLIRAGAPIQAGLLALVLLALPIVFRLGPFLIFATFALAIWIYLSFTERIVLSCALLALIAAPWLTQVSVQATVWTGTLAEQIYELEHGPSDDAVAAALVSRSTTEDLPSAAKMALGRYYKRRGDFDSALRWYDQAKASESRSSEIEVNRGNVFFLKSNLETAKASYLGVTDAANVDVSTLAAANYNLYKLYARIAALGQADESRRKALLQDQALIERSGSEDDFHANSFLIDVPVAREHLERVAATDRTPHILAEAARTRIAGAVPAAAWPWLPLAFVGLLWLLSLAGGRLGPSCSCDRCGRPACRRCDGVNGIMCGQCVNVFTKKGVVDARDRLLKESQVRRHQRWTRLLTRVLAVAGGGTGHLFTGDAIRGFLFLFGILFFGFIVGLWDGVIPARELSGYAVVGRLTLAIPLGLALYALAVRDVFRRS